MENLTVFFKSEQICLSDLRTEKFLAIKNNNIKREERKNPFKLLN